MKNMTKSKASSKLQYCRVETLTLAGIKRAERLQAQGWKIISSTMFAIQFEKRTGA